MVRQWKKWEKWVLAANLCIYHGHTRTPPEAPDFVRSSYNKTKKNSLFPLFPLFNRNPGQKPKIGSFKNSLFPLFQWKNSRSHSPDSLYAWEAVAGESVFVTSKISYHVSVGSRTKAEHPISTSFAGTGGISTG